MKEYYLYFIITCGYNETGLFYYNYYLGRAVFKIIIAAIFKARYKKKSDPFTVVLC